MVDEMAKSDLDLVVAGTGDAVMMVELEAKELPEKQMLEAVMFGHRGFQPVIQAIIKLAEKAAKEPWDFQPPDKSKYVDKVKALVEADLRKAFATPEKQKRHELVEAASAKVKKELLPADADASEQVLLGSVFKGLEQDVVRGDIITTQASASTAATSRPCARSAPRCTCCRARTARRSSRAARRRPSSSPRSAPARTSSTSTRWKARARSASCCTTTSRPTRSARRAAWARPAGARSATASSPGAPCIR